MAHAILMPKPGQMTEECALVAWHKREGDPVRRGDVLFEIETDKSNMDVEAFDDGVLLRRYVEEGETVPVNAVCAYVGEPGEEVPERLPATPVDGHGPDGTLPGAPVTVPATATVARSDSGPGRRLAISPRASRLAAEAGLDPRRIAGSGPGGRVVERDVRSAIEAAAMPAASAAFASSTGSEPPLAAAPAPMPPPAVVDSTGWAEEDPPRPLSRMRRVIAQRLGWSAATIPHFTVTVAVDMTRLVALRQQLKANGTNLSVTDFVMAATAQTLAEFPDVNSRTDGQLVWPRRRVHLGIAVSVPNGLVVAVIRDADRRSLVEIHDRGLALAEGARAGTLSPDEMQGSTFTVSNLGMFGVDEFTAIINPGEAGILAVSSIIPTAVAIGDGLAVRQVMKLTLAADHRLVDGEVGARFLNAIRRRLQDAEAFRAESMHS